MQRIITVNLDSFEDETAEIAESAINNITDNGDDHADYDPVAAVLEQEQENDLVYA